MSKSFTIAQLSDPHLSSLDGVSIRDLFNKRMLGYLSWYFNRRLRYRPEILAALVKDIKLQSPDHILVTGDLTHIGLPHEFYQVKKWLDALGPPSAVTVVPGNHDAYIKSKYDEVLSVWDAYLASDPAVKPKNGETDYFPILRVRGRVAFIGLSTAISSPPFFAVGKIGWMQLKALEKMLIEMRTRGLFRVIFLHHPPIPGTVSWAKRLIDHGQFYSILKEHGAELVLHGHAHHSSINEMVSSGVSIPTIGVAAASAISEEKGRVAQYHMYRVASQEGVWSVQLTVREYSHSSKRFVEVGLPVTL